MFPFTPLKFTARCSPVFIVASGEFLSGLDSKSALFSEGFSVQELQHKERISSLPWVRMRSCCYFNAAAGGFEDGEGEYFSAR